MKIKIDSQIPLKGNTRSGRGKSEESQALFDLEIDQSFFCELTPNKVWGRIYNFRRDGKLEDRDFSIRSLVENNIKGCRVWRIA